MPKKSSRPASSRKGKSTRRRFPRDYAASRFRTHRLHDLLSAGETVTVERLKEEFGVSVRTIKTDIKNMREEDGAPIKWSQQRMSYVYARPYDGKPLLRISNDEALTLALSARRFGATPGSPLALAFRSVLKKIGPLVGGDTTLALDAMRDVLVAPDDHAATEDRHIPVLHEAIARRVEVRVVYQKPTEAPAERTLRPLHLAYVGQCWMLFARDVRKPATDQTFLVLRMLEVKKTDTRFVRPPEFDAEKMLRGSLGRYAGKGDYEVRIAYDQVGAAYARERLPRHMHHFSNRPDGRIELTVRVNNLIEIEKEVLRAGEHAEVVSPPELRERVREILRVAWKRYEGGEGL